MALGAQHEDITKEATTCGKSTYRYNCNKLIHTFDQCGQVIATQHEDVTNALRLDLSLVQVKKKRCICLYPDQEEEQNRACVGVTMFLSLEQTPGSLLLDKSMWLVQLTAREKNRM